MRLFITFVGILMSASILSAQDEGYLTGSFETTDHSYVKDAANKFTPADDPFGSNNYLKLRLLINLKRKNLCLREF